jgi:hypothetical protein
MDKPDKASRFRDKFAMTCRAASPDDIAAERLAMMEGWRTREGRGREAAREALAREVGVSPGQLERVRRRRVKGVRAWISEAIRTAFANALEREIASLTHELAVARAAGLGDDQAAMRFAVGAFEEARALVERG